MPFATDTANSVLGWAFGKNTLANNSKVYIGLSSNDPEADSGTFTELSGGGYTRVLLSVYNNQYPDYIGAAANREIKNAKQIAWPKATADWTTAKGFGLFTAETGGKPYYYGALSAAVTCATGEICEFDPNTLRIKLAAVDELLTDVNALLGD